MNFLTYLLRYAAACNPRRFKPVWRGVPMGKTFYYPEHFDHQLSMYQALHHEDLTQTRIGAQRTGKRLTYAAHFVAKLSKLRTVVAYEGETWKAYRTVCEQARGRERKRLGQIYHSLLRPRTLPPSFNLLLTRTGIGDTYFNYHLNIIVVSLRYHWDNLNHGVANAKT